MLSEAVWNQQEVPGWGGAQERLAPTDPACRASSGSGLSLILLIGCVQVEVVPIFRGLSTSLGSLPKGLFTHCGLKLAACP